MDRDTKFTQHFKAFLKREGVTTVVYPPKVPNCSPYAERFVRSIKEECLDRIISIGVGSLRRAVNESIAHYQRERNHQGLSNRLIEPVNVLGYEQNGAVHCRERLGGLLNYYYRLVAWPCRSNIFTLRAAESTINQVVSERFVNKQQMRWTERVAHLLFQTRTQTLNDDLRSTFETWYPDMREAV